MTAVNGSVALTPEDDGRESAALLQAMYSAEFEEFTESKYHDLERILLAGCPQRELVKDALHDALLLARAEWPRIRTYARREGWVIITARHKILKEHGRLRRESAMAPEDLPPAPHPDVADAWAARETVQNWLQRLPPRHAEVFRMSRVGFSNHDIAVLLGVTESSVRFYKSAAKTRLREMAVEAGYSVPEGRRRRGGSRGSR